MNRVGSEGDFASGVEDVFLAGFEAWGELGQVSATPLRKPGFFKSEVACTSTLWSRTSGDCLAEHGSGSGRGA